MENNHKIKKGLPDKFKFQLSGLSRNLWLKIGRHSIWLSMIGMILGILFFIFLVGSYFAQRDSFNEQLHYLIPLLTFASPSISMLIAFYHLRHFGIKTKKAFYHDDESMLSEGLKQLNKFIQLAVWTLLFFLFTAILNAFYIQRIFEVWNS